MLTNIEKSFYGSKHTKTEIGKKARLITKVHVMLYTLCYNWTT